MQEFNCQASMMFIGNELNYTFTLQGKTQEKLFILMDGINK